ncbi:MAG: hypothetical protein P8O06_11605 [Porticoccaceae bacterium]|nr:hypothetical protein [Porticoccaceae bacterium]
MSIKRFSSMSYILIIIVLLWACVSVMVLGDVSVYDENNLLENIQALTLGLSLLLFLMPLADRSRNDRLIAAFFSVLVVGFILRELDVEKFDLPSIIVFVGSGKGRNAMLAIGFFVLLSVAVFNFRYYFSLAKCFIRSRVGITAIIAGIFLIVGDMFEKIDIPHHVLIEESFELIGYTILLAAASSVARREIRSDTFIR